ncbi:hypothetical protein B0T26DRAFT_678877 [Lasiosphaeria miniovina]|uniref:Uncharacterized protein n=1 Tax=Lasiosphaeria miniovina TaxID=1954250 RepID=A0AA40DRM8_9PEZI|nr:uncharacterized protein B0T26DRAFT_678877 [Lasiosphaeria miniovina]KAK0709458.1 hypothetical protein B0T26DRAFT_678877 [Lasiosphaeria miniovina]
MTKPLSKDSRPAEALSLANFTKSQANGNWFAQKAVCETVAIDDPWRWDHAGTRISDLLKWLAKAGERRALHGPDQQILGRSTIRMHAAEDSSCDQSREWRRLVPKCRVLEEFTVAYSASNLWPRPRHHGVICNGDERAKPGVDAVRREMDKGSAPDGWDGMDDLQLFLCNAGHCKAIHQPGLARTGRTRGIWYCLL